MDSILGDSFMNGRRMRPASLEYALTNYPKFIVWMKLGKLNISAQNSCDGNDVVVVSKNCQPEHFLVMTRSDFEKCRSIAEQMTVPLFASDTDKELFDRAAAYVRESFG